MKKIIRTLFNYFGYEIIKQQVLFKKLKNISTEKGYEYYETNIGNYFLPIGTSEDMIAKHMRSGLLFEPEVVDIAKKYIVKGTNIIDVGANFGQMSIAFAKIAGEQGTVYSFEAQKLVFEVLAKNAVANFGESNTRIKPFYNAVFNESNKEFVFPEPDFSKFKTYGSFGLDPNVQGNGDTVTTIKIDDIQFDKPISFMKIDIQGSDLSALLGAKETILKHKMPILFEFEQQFQSTFNTSFQDYVDFVESIDYKFEQTVLDINFLIVPKTK